MTDSGHAETVSHDLLREAEESGDDEEPDLPAGQRGAGSHGTLYFGERFTVVKDLKKEPGPGLLADICKQPGVRKEDL